MTVKEKRVWVYCNEINGTIYKDAFSHRYDVSFFNQEGDFISSLSSVKIPDMIILEANDNNAFTLQKIKPVLEAIPSILVSDSDDLEFIHFCYEVGVSEIFVKPTPQNLLRAKIKRLLYPEFNSYKKSNLERRFDELSLTIKEIKILRALLGSPTKRLHRADLVKSIWGGLTVHHKTLDVHIYNLRKKLIGTEFTIISEGSGQFSVRVSYNSISQQAI